MATEEAVREQGLRERKKQRTRETIVHCAWDLFEAQGFAETTIPQIAAAADVSPRTVSSYFPHKEELVFPDKDAMLGAVRQALISRPKGEPAIDALGRWIESWLLERDPVEIKHSRDVRALINSDAGLRAYQRGLQEQAEIVIAEAVGSDLALPPDHHMPRMVGAATLAALDSLSGDDDSPSPERARELVADVMRFVAGGVRELGER